jgi:uncharacterized protein YndB with AHSA1/START domain
MTATAHDTFTIERIFDAPLSMVFEAWADKKAKARWFRGGDDWSEQVREQNFEVGGRDELSGKWKSGNTTHFKAQYFDIVPGERIVYVYEMFLGDRKISVSLATVEFHPHGRATRLTVTEQGAFLDGYEDNGNRKHGIGVQMDMLAQSLR